MTLAASQPSGSGLAWHVRRTLQLAAPISVARAAILIIYVVDTIMTGWAGPEQLGALGLGVSPQLTFMLVSIGILQSTAVLTAQAVGAGEPRRTGAIFRSGLMHAAGLGLAGFALSFAAPWFFRLTGQPADVIDDAAAVTIAFAAGVPGMLLFVTANMFLEATFRPKVGMIIMLVINVINVPLNGILVLGWGGFVEPMGAVGAVAGSSALRWLAFFMTLAVLVMWDARLDDPRGLIEALKRRPSRDTSHIGRTIRRIGLPIGIAQGVESAAFSSMIFIAGLIGKDAIAAHQATIALVSFVYMIAIGVSAATAIRVGNAVGRNLPDDVRFAGWSGIILAGCLAAPLALLFVLRPELVASIYGLEGAALKITAATIAAGGLVLVFDGMMGASLGALRGVGDVWVPLGLQIVAFWVVAVPLSALFAIGHGIGAPGLWYGILCGVGLSIVFMAARFRTVSRRTIARL
ncbi:MAG TPA: MATE family efflux transporter [Afifellaceae bacterium]|nr:MATE family efflux transporter [Afifellaceae bacterium]